MTSALHGGGQDFVPLAILFLVLGLYHVVQEGYLVKDPPNERRQRQKLGLSAATLLGTRQHLQGVVLCDAGLYPPLASLLFVDLFYKRRLLIWSDTDVVLSAVGRRSQVAYTLFKGSRCDVTAPNLWGLFATLHVGPNRVWVHRRYFSAIRSISCRSGPRP